MHAATGIRGSRNPTKKVLLRTHKMQQLILSSRTLGTAVSQDRVYKVRPGGYGFICNGSLDVL